MVTIGTQRVKPCASETSQYVIQTKTDPPPCPSQTVH